MTDLSGRELDEACAKARGYRTEWRDGILLRRGIYGGVMGIPEYHASFDAAYRDLLPECQRRGYSNFEITNGRVVLFPDDEAWEEIEECGHSLPETFARACYTALSEV